MQTVHYNVPDISCGHCKESIEGAVGSLGGVSAVTVEVDTKTVDVSFDGAKLAEDAIIAAIEEQGYEVAR